MLEGTCGAIQRDVHGLDVQKERRRGPQVAAFAGATAFLRPGVQI